MKPGNLLLEKIRIGGINQWISIRGNPKKSICLFLHGGPGLAEMPLLHSYCSKLENDFLIVNWDQRGAGKSFSPFISSSSMNLDQFIEDASYLIRHILKRFKKQKLHLIGHSWGSALGMFLVQRNPNLIYSYIGIGQIGNWAEGEKISYQFTKKRALELNSKSGIRSLNKIGPPPHNWQKLIRQRRLLLKYGGSIYGQKNYKELIPKYIFSEEYNLLDLLKFPVGIYFSLKNLWSQLTKIDLCLDVPEVKIPVCFMLGRHDYQVPYECSVNYYEKLKAPNKSLVWFEKSGHTPMFEEPDKFINTISTKLKQHNEDYHS